MLEPVSNTISPVRMPQEVARRCLEMIVRGDYPPGSQLPSEGELAEIFGVSRIVVREAVRILGAKGVVTARQGRQTEINPMADWNALDSEILVARVRAGQLGPLAGELVHLRKVLEAEAVALAAKNATDEDVANLRAVLDQMLTYSGDTYAFPVLESEFHRLIWRAAHNNLMWHLLNALDAVFLYARRVIFQHLSPLDNQDHLALFSAIERHDAEAARAAMIRDIERFENELRVALENGGRLGDEVLTRAGIGSSP